MPCSSHVRLIRERDLVNIVNLFRCSSSIQFKTVFNMVVLLLCRGYQVGMFLKSLWVVPPLFGSVINPLWIYKMLHCLCSVLLKVCFFESSYRFFSRHFTEYVVTSLAFSQVWQRWPVMNSSTFSTSLTTKRKYAQSPREGSGLRPCMLSWSSGKVKPMQTTWTVRGRAVCRQRGHGCCISIGKHKRHPFPSIIQMFIVFYF